MDSTKKSNRFSIFIMAQTKIVILRFSKINQTLIREHLTKQIKRVHKMAFQTQLIKTTLVETVT